MAYLISIDSGGTHTTGQAILTSGEVVGEATSGFGNPMVDAEVGLANIVMVIEQLMTQMSGQNCTRIVVGVAGIDSGQYRSVYIERLRTFNTEVILLNDAQLAYLAKLGGKTGLLVIAGTGAVALARVGNEWYRAGGWGHLVDSDPGSAYWIGMQAVKHLLIQLEKNESLDAISQSVSATLRVDSIRACLTFIYAENKNRVAELAVGIAELAYQKNRLALEILRLAGEELGKTVERLLQTHATIQYIAESGTVFEKNQLVKTAFEAYLTNRFAQVKFIQGPTPAVYGGFYYESSEGIK